MAEQPHVQTGPGRSEQSITIKLSEDALPIGLMPPTFPPDYVAGSVVPFFLAGSYVGETPSLPMVDLTLSVEFIKEFLRVVWKDKISFVKLDIEHAGQVPVNPRTVLNDDIAFTRAK